MTGHDDAALTATAALQRIRAGTLTSEALVAACLERIQARDGGVGAWAHLNPEKALRDAREADAQRGRGGPARPLDGIPVGVKDIVDTAEYPTEYGSVVFKGNVPATDATIVGELKRAGAIILGKTVTTEFAFFGPGKTRNPRNPGHIPGGSSSGSAAAVADFQVPLAIGTQTAGSVIRPASFCGTIGFKPTFGTISRTGILPQSPPLDTVGGYARTVDDVALLVDAIAAFDPRDGDMTSSPKPSLTAAVANPLDRPPRFAFIKSPAWRQADERAQRAIEAYAGGFGANAEVVVVDTPADFDGSLRLQQIVQFPTLPRTSVPLPTRTPIASLKS